jgi:ArsR family transcriptional regulator, arsenate/arsenite/antimonite-responsive transcriptional repressor
MVNASTPVNGVRVPARKDTTSIRDDLCCSPLTSEPLTKREAEQSAPVLAALGDPVRLRLLSIVAAEGEVCSCNLEGPLGKSQPTISHHTRILAEAGLIVGERRGKWTWWRIVPGRLEDLRRLLGGR